MEIFRWLPNEVLVQIIQHSAKGDQAVLARVSKLFRDLCLPVLNREVTINFPSALKSSRAMTSFCFGIIENPTRADAVRSFSLNSHIEIRHDLVRAAFELMSKLDHLSIDGFYRPICVLLAECNFPQLTSCEIWAARGANPPPEQASAVAIFLAKHSTIKRLRLHSGKVFVSLLGRLSLPNLEYCEGDAKLLLVIDNVIGLKEVRLNWTSEDDAESDGIIVRLNSMTKSDLPFVSSHEFFDEPSRIVTSVSTYMPYTRTLRLYSYFAPVGHDLISDITDCLPNFTNLVHLAIEWPNYGQSRAKTKDEGRIVSERWGEACASLEACCLNHCAWRKIDGRWEDCPVKEFWVLAGLPDLATRY
ncbi:hypothetical protein MSAN_01188500 [Mycena sanguinolenta]|uniref:F-box domain-containing protein n=1 Tax=Mycena sanguinolenta TaxID=230812 RepID=A0A8H6YNF5_9AGAR|nr:hypothetical protein MSAN_01188500 [Mycena sanguinolenta]